MPFVLTTNLPLLPVTVSELREPAYDPRATIAFHRSFYTVSIGASPAVGFCLNECFDQIVR
jgi:hypothetical protein